MKIIIAGGGTGGHLFPGIAIAEEFLKRDAATEVVFIGTARGLEQRVLPAAGYKLHTLDVEGIKGRGFRSLVAAAKIPGSLCQAVRIIREFRPDIVIGVGGYASGPAVAAAWLLGIPTAIAEQNAVPGVTNRILGKLADRVFLTFPDRQKQFPARKVIVSGNPVRSAFGKCAARQADGFFTVLVFGGSQGARRINQAMLEAIPFLTGMNGLKIVHQTGAAEYEQIAGFYRTAGLQIEALPFISEMAAAYAAADLLICRAGATSIAEITACGKASILIPFPYAVNDHQTENARILADGGAAELLPEQMLTGEKLAESIWKLYEDRDRLAGMAVRAAELGNLGAAAVMVDRCLELINK